MLIVHLFLYDKNIKQKQGHYIANDVSHGLAKELHISNSSESREIISYRFEAAGAFPKSFSAYLYDNDTRQYSSNGTISVEPHSTVTKWIVVGDAHWQDQFINSAKPFPTTLQILSSNPARSSVTIKYSQGLNPHKQMNITILDLHGRTVWKKQIITQLSPGYHYLTWNGTDQTHAPVGAGMYIVRMSTIDSNEKSFQQLDQRFTYLP